MRRYSLSIFAIIMPLLFLISPSYARTLGPCTGQVVDSRTGEPIAGASVLVYWEKAIPNIEGSSEYFLALSSDTTDEKGMYLVPRVSADLGLLEFMGSSHIIVYQPGYKAYIASNDFKKRSNLVKLELTPPDFDHRAHYEDIREELWFGGVDQYEKVYTGILMTGRQRKTGPMPELDAFLRRLEWEYRREPDKEAK